MKVHYDIRVQVTCQKRLVVTRGLCDNGSTSSGNSKSTGHDACLRCPLGTEDSWHPRNTSTPLKWREATSQCLLFILSLPSNPDIHSHSKCSLFVNFSNAFNSIDRAHMFQEVRSCIPDMAAWVASYYSSQLILLFGDFEFLSCDFGPTMFCPYPPSISGKDPICSARLTSQCLLSGWWDLARPSKNTFGCFFHHRIFWSPFESVSQQEQISHLFSWRLLYIHWLLPVCCSYY